MANTALNPKTTKEQALSAVQAAGSQTQRLIDLWLEHQNTAALLEVSTHGTGQPRKAARRALKALERRGVELPRIRRIAKLGGSKTAETQQAWLLAPDPAFNVLLVIGRRQDTSSRWRTAMVFLNDAYGVMQVQQGEFSQSGLKKALQSFVPAARYKPTEVNVEWARSRINQVLLRQRERGLVEPLGLTSVSDLLHPVPEQDVPHPFESEGLEMAVDDAREMSQNSGTLHTLPEFRAWLPPRAAIDEMLRDVGKHLTAGETPDQSKLQQLLKDAVVSATDRFFTVEQRQRLVQVMKDSCLSVLAREGETDALRVAAVMQCILEAGLITNPPSEIPFLRMFFDKAIAYLLAEGKGSLQIPVVNAAATAPSHSDVATDSAAATGSGAPELAHDAVQLDAVTGNDPPAPPGDKA